MGGGDINVPPPSQEEQELLAQQTALLQQQTGILEAQQKQQELLAPILFEQIGINAVRDEQGNIIGFEEEPDPLAGLRQEAEKLLLERSLAAQRGELPTSPQLLEELRVSEANLRESLRKSLGPDFESTTGGSQALSQFTTTKENILESARRGDITLAESLGLAREESNRIRGLGTIAGAAGVEGRGLSLAQAFGGAAGGFSGPLSILQGNRQLALQAQLASAQADPTAALFGGIGSLAGLLGSAAIFKSSEELKEDIEEIDTSEVVEKMRDLPIMKWSYKGEKVRHLGPMAERFSDAFGVGDGKTIHMADVTGVMLSVAKELSKKAA